MENLRELIGIITKHKMKGLEPIGPHNPLKSKLKELYDGIEKNEFSTEKEAIVSIYGNQKNGKQNFQKLKSRLEERLLNTVFFIDINKLNHNDIQEAFYASHKDWATIKILLGKGARLTAISLAEKLLIKAEKFEFSGIILDIARILRFHYATIDHNKKKYQKYGQLVKKHMEIITVETLAEEYYTEISSQQVDPKISKQSLLQKAKKYSATLRKRTANLNSYRLNLLSRLVFVYRYQVENDYEKIIEECEKAIAFFESKPHQASKTALFTFSFKLLACYIQLKKFNKGEQVANKCFDLITEGTLNWFYTYQLYITLCLHTQKFQEAYDAYNKAAKHKNFRRLYAKPTENWKIFEAYIKYFISNKEIKPNPDLPLKKFRIPKFLNEVPIYSKDKRGKNIPILIIHILFLLQREKYVDVIDRVETINQYTYRYLRKDESYRSNCFIKMLLQLPKGNFHKQAVIRKASPYYEKLKSVPLEISDQYDEIEIVPYEILWEYVLDTLDNKFH